MRQRLSAVLVHGMGNDASWWDPLASELAEMEIDVEALTLPSLLDAGPESWVEEVVRSVDGKKPLLVGHSLGAAVALEAAQRVPVAGVVLLACPVFFGERVPPSPQGAQLPLTAAARVLRFLRGAASNAGGLGAPVAHFLGDADRYVSLDDAGRLPFPVSVVPAADHDLSQSASFRKAFFRHIAAADYGRSCLDPAVRCSREADPLAFPAEALRLDETAAPPARLDVEITTRCQLACPRCARSRLTPGERSTDLSPGDFARVLSEAEFARELIFVGLGEPLLHPDLDGMVELSARRGLETKLVTNGLLATPERLATLADAGLAEVTFSIDTTDAPLFRQLRGGASLPVVLKNFRGVPNRLRRSIFATLSRANADQIPGLVDLAVKVGLPAIALSDVNFEENQGEALHGADLSETLVQAIRYARAKGVLLISPRFHDVGDAPRNYRRCLVRLPADLSSRSPRHRNCLAPWRIAAVGADGTLNPCNCAPWKKAGDLLREGLRSAWNGADMKEWRRSVMQGENAPCSVCPRF